MQRKTLVTILMVFAFTLTALAAPLTVLAQDDDGPLVCDSTLTLLLYIAEHDFDYLSGVRMNQEGAREIDFGQFTPLINETVAMMTAMMGDMTEDEMMAMDEMNAMVEPMMMMDMQGVTDAYMTGMGMESMDLAMYSTLPDGAVEGEDPGCTALRAEVSQFLLAHIIAESAMMMEHMDDM